MNASIESARSHPAVVASLVAAALAVAACALVAIAYMLGWLPSKPMPAGPTSVAIPGQQVAGSGPDLALLPGESVVAAPDASLANPSPPPSAIPPAPKEAPLSATASSPKPSPEAAKRALEGARLALEAKSASAPRQPAPPIYAPSAPPPSSSATYTQVLPSRAAPSKPNYTRNEVEAPYASYERPARAVCVNCGVVASIRSGDIDWEVRVRFDDGSAETLRYPDRPRLRVGDRVHLEDGRLVAD